MLECAAAIALQPNWHLRCQLRLKTYVRRNVPVLKQYLIAEDHCDRKLDCLWSTPLSLTKMKILIVISLLLGPVLSLQAGPPCRTINFRTKGYKEACAEGGQKQAKEFAKAYLKEIKKSPLGKRVVNCNSCHSALAPNYTLKDSALNQYFASGNK